MFLRNFTSSQRHARRSHRVQFQVESLETRDLKSGGAVAATPAFTTALPFSVQDTSSNIATPNLSAGTMTLAEEKAWLKTVARTTSSNQFITQYVYSASQMTSMANDGKTLLSPVGAPLVSQQVTMTSIDGQPPGQVS